LFVRNEGVWKKLPASFKGLQQDGRLYEMDKDDLKDLQIAA
jgi:hypothetical protein